MVDRLSHEDELSRQDARGNRDASRVTASPSPARDEDSPLETPSPLRSLSSRANRSMSDHPHLSVDPNLLAPTTGLVPLETNTSGDAYSHHLTRPLTDHRQWLSTYSGMSGPGYVPATDITMPIPRLAGLSLQSTPSSSSSTQDEWDDSPLRERRAFPRMGSSSTRLVGDQGNKENLRRPREQVRK